MKTGSSGKMLLVAGVFALVVVAGVAAWIIRSRHGGAPPSPPAMSAQLGNPAKPAAACQTPGAPSRVAALQALLGGNVSSEKVRVDEDIAMSIWFEQCFEQGGLLKKAVFMQSQTVDPKTGQHEVEGAIDPAVVSAVVYRYANDRWTLESKAAAFGRVGNNGEAPGTKEAQMLPLNAQTVAFLPEERYTQMGVVGTVKHIFSYDGKSWVDAETLDTGEENGGDCDDDGAKSDPSRACYDYSGTVSVAANSGGSYADLVVTQTGSIPVAGGQSVKQRVVRYAFQGGKYAEAKGR